MRCVDLEWEMGDLTLDFSGKNMRCADLEWEMGDLTLYSYVL